MNTTAFTGIGLMCGTSHDALDIGGVHFGLKSGVWSYQLLASNTVPIPSNLLKQLEASTSMSALELASTDLDFSKFCADSVNQFIEDGTTTYDFIASHGVTVFHDPDNGINLQIGSGALISALTNHTVVCDFRSQDVALKGQGAPLVPLADSHLFSNYEYTLNLGGFANLATNAASNISGFDICVCNLALNNIALQLGHPFDDGGELAKSGQLNKPLLDSLNNLDYYLDLPPKSLGTEWVAEHITTLLMGNLSAPIDLLHTLSEHIAIQIGTALPSAGRCLVTGGGAYNTYLIERIRHFAGCDIIIPDKNVIDYKEAIDFAFLGALRLLGQTNVLSSVTGAKNDTISGAVYIAQS